MLRRLAVLAAALGALGLGGTASAAAPQTVRTDFDGLAEPLDCGSYSLEHRVSGHETFREFLKNGELVRTLENFAVKHTWTNLDTGESLSSPDVGANHLIIRESKGGATLYIVGILVRVVVPGQGLVAGELGLETLFFTGPDDPDPDITIHGMHDDVLEALCTALAPPA
jgi:hypothetical protein